MAVLSGPPAKARRAPRVMPREEAMAFLRAAVGLAPLEGETGAEAVHAVVPAGQPADDILTLYRTPHQIRRLKDEGIIGVT